MATRRTARESSVSTARIEAFSDGVFAIAITLLVLQLNLPHLPVHPTDRDLWNALFQMAPSYFTFVLSFAVIGRYWLAHHALFHRIQKSDGKLAVLNLLLLLTVVALPFPTEVLGQYGNLAAAVIFYAVSISLIGLMMGVLWRHAVKRGLLYPDVSQRTIRNSYYRSSSVPIIFLASVPVAAFVSVGWAETMWILTFFAGVFLKNDGSRTS
jgi:uncharacterized membrane protein